MSEQGTEAKLPIDVSRYVSKEELEKIRTIAKNIIKDRTLMVRNSQFWECVGVSVLLGKQVSIGRKDLAVFSKLDEKGEITDVELVAKQHCVYPAVADTLDNLTQEGFLRDEALTETLQTHFEQGLIQFPKGPRNPQSQPIR